MEPNKIYYHKGQLRSILAAAHTDYIVAGRGWGKSEGPGAKRLADLANNMPRGSIGVVGSTYMQLLDRTLPPVYRAWERLGYHRGVHYWPRKKPPSELNIKLPFYAPDTDANTIYWWNGACFKLISQDRPGSANGTTLDALYGDEAKLINKKKFDLEIDKANRGNVGEFGGNYAGHHANLWMTDMPTDPKGKWILEKANDLQLDIKKGDKVFKMFELINLIINYQLFINKLYFQREKFQERSPERKVLNRQIYSAERKINELRIMTVNYGGGPSWDNIHFLGLDTLKKWKRDDLEIDFRTQVGNQQIYTVTNSFYDSFDTETHCDDKFNYDYIDGLNLWLPNGIERNCLRDGDITRNAPLDIAMDAGTRINCLIVGQEKADHYRFLKSMFVKKPALITDVVDNFCEYYDKHDKHEVNFYYDHTFVGTDATRLYSYADTVRNTLIKHKWRVNMINIGQQPPHDTRYRMWGEVLQEKLRNKMPVRFNKTNCAQLIIAVQLAGALQGKLGTEKDKRPEKRLDVPAEEATHLTDAMDTLYIGRFQHRLGYAPATTEAFFGTQSIYDES